MNLSGTGRAEVVQMVATLRAENDRLRDERDSYARNLTTTQARCTELLLENRDLRRRMQATALVDLFGAIEIARQKHPEGCNLNALFEEVGEVARAVRREGHERVRAELLDVAVVAMRLWLGEHAEPAVLPVGA